MSGHGEPRSAHCRRRGMCKALPLLSSLPSQRVAWIASARVYLRWILRSDAYSTQVADLDQQVRPKRQPQRSTRRPNHRFSEGAQERAKQNSCGCFRNCEHREHARRSNVREDLEILNDHVEGRFAPSNGGKYELPYLDPPRGVCGNQSAPHRPDSRRAPTQGVGSPTQVRRPAAGDVP